MDVAALDLGSNSFHLLVAHLSEGRIQKLAAHKRTLALGAHVQATGHITPAVMEQALEAVEALVGHARQLTRAPVIAVGTSALREAQNRSEFVRLVQKRLAVAVEILSGDAEAQLAYAGARSALAGLPERVAVVDIGGGSVEIAVGHDGLSRPLASLPLGFLRLGRMLNAAAPLNLSQVRGKVMELARGVSERAACSKPEAWIFSGGTARAFQTVAEALGAAKSMEISAHRVREVAERILTATPDQLQAWGVDVPRLPTLGIGSALLSSMVELLQAPAILVSSGGLREGIVLREAQAADAAERRRPSAPPSSPFASLAV